jgi:hypothetical protein
VSSSKHHEGEPRDELPDPSTLGPSRRPRTRMPFKPLGLPPRARSRRRASGSTADQPPREKARRLRADRVGVVKDAIDWYKNP